MGTKDYAEYYERLTSYTNWAGDVTIYVKALVEAGFVYSGENDTVFCYKCGVAAKGWKEDDDPIKRHEDLNKTCYFLSERSRNIVGGQEIPCSSLADFEEQQTVYDWVPGSGVVNRKDGNAHGSGVTKNATDDQNATVGTVNLAGLHKREMRFERSRFESYAMCDIHKHWPSPEELSSKGFYYDAKRKVTCCFCCGATAETWESSSQDVDQKHKSMSPNCRFLHKEPCGNVLLNEDMEEFRDERKLFDALSINKEAENKRNAIDPYVAFPNQRQESYQNNAYQPHQPPSYLGGQYAPTYTPTIRPNGYVDPPKSPLKKDPRKSSGDYSDETKRLNTFFTWPQTAYIEPIELARAGFIYSGTGDAVKCYKCGVSLRNWEPNDNAWAEHEKWSPNCKLVIECIQEAQRIKNTPPHMIQESSYSSLNEAQIRQNHLQHLLLQQQQHPNESSRSLPTGVGNQYALNQYAGQNKLTNTEQPNYDNYRGYMNTRQSPLMQHMYNAHHPVNQPNMMSQNPSYHNPVSNHINLTSQNTRPSSNMTYNHSNQMKMTSHNPNSPSQFYNPSVAHPSAPRPSAPRPYNSSNPISNRSYEDNLPRYQPRQSSYSNNLERQRQYFKQPSESSYHSSLGMRTPQEAEYSFRSDALPPVTSPTESSIRKERKSVSQEEIQSLSTMGFSPDVVQQTLDCYQEYASRSFSSIDDLAQAVLYFQDHRTLEGTPFGRNLNVSPSKAGEEMIFDRAKSEKQLSVKDDYSETDRQNCKICMDNDVEVTFVPCGHLVVCESCALGVKICPICRDAIQETVRTYYFGN